MTGLDPWHATHNDPGGIAMAVLGDSTSEGVVSVTNGGWPEQLRLLADPRWPRGGDGMHPMNRGAWSLTSGGDAWTAATSSDTWDRAPMRGAVGTPAANTYLGNGAAKIATWTLPAGLTPTALTLHVIDGASAGDFAYSIDGGAWTDVSETWAADNSIKRIRINLGVASPVTATVRIRAADAAGSATNVYLVGLAPHDAVTGWTIHNLAANSEFLSTMVRTGAGDWSAWLTTVQPSLVTIMFTNDVLIYDSSAWEANLEAVVAAVTGYGGSVLAMAFFEQPGRDIEIQAEMRSKVRAVAVQSGMPYIDLYALAGDNAATVAAGYMDADDIHANDAGSVFIAQQIWPVLAKSRHATQFRAAA